MIDDRDLRLVLLALRDGLIDPARLAELAGTWPPQPPTPFSQFLINQGLLTPELRDRLERAAGESTPSAGGDESQLSTATVESWPADPPVTADDGPRANGPPDRCPPAVGKRYKVESLYRGGLGRVWRARDTAVGRAVALKDLRPERRRDPSLRNRFVEEARITGQLEHPCIVPLYDLIDGPAGPCYTMRFVAGRTLSEAARDYHDRRIAGRDDPLALTALLDAFVAVCRAVAFAHNRGVLHRDLKGQNIVLGEYGEVFVLDWGLAKLSGDPMTVEGPAVVTPTPAGPREETVSGAVLGTPAFMAPELADGRAASRASDVYGLGGVLYVILTGLPPYDGATVPDVLRQVLAGPPPGPRTLNPACPPALEAICRTAMARDPAARYATADAVAADVRRWLADEPVSVYRERWPVRLTRWGRRHRAAVLGTTAVLLTAVIGLAASTLLVWQEERRTAEQKTHAEHEWVRAEGNLGLASGLAFNLLETADKNWPPNNPRSAAGRRDMTEAAINTFRRFLSQRPDDKTARQQTAKAYHYSANFHRQLNELTEADTLYRESVAEFEALIGRYPNDSTLTNDLAETLRDQAQLLGRRGRVNDAIAAGRRAATLAETLVAAEPANTSYRRTLATGLIDLAGYEHSRGQFVEAEMAARRSAELLVGLVGRAGETPPPPEALYLAMALHRRAMALGELDRLDQSLTVSQDALATLKPLPPSDNNAQHFMARSLLEQAKVRLKMAGRRAEAVKQAEADAGRAIALWTDLQTRLPQFLVYREWQAGGFEVRGRIRLTAGSADLAAADLDKSRSMLEKLVAEYPDLPSYRSLVGQSYLTLGRSELRRGNKPKAEEWLSKAREALRTAVKKSPEDALDQRALGEVEAELVRVH